MIGLSKLLYPGYGVTKLGDLWSTFRWRKLVEHVMRLPSIDPKAQAFKAIGYRQIIQHLEGNLLLDEAMEEIKRETRRFAKRQLTWFRADPTLVWIEGLAGKEALTRRGSELVRAFLGRRETL